MCRKPKKPAEFKVVNNFKQNSNKLIKKTVLMLCNENRLTKPPDSLQNKANSNIHSCTNSTYWISNISIELQYEKIFD